MYPPADKVDLDFEFVYGAEAKMRGDVSSEQI